MVKIVLLYFILFELDLVRRIVHRHRPQAVEPDKKSTQPTHLVESVSTLPVCASIENVTVILLYESQSTTLSRLHWIGNASYVVNKTQE